MDFWTNQWDIRLLSLVPQTAFDFNVVASTLVKEGCTKANPENCRLRFASLKNVNKASSGTTNNRTPTGMHSTKPQTQSSTDLDLDDLLDDDDDDDNNNEGGKKNNGNDDDDTTDMVNKSRIGLQPPLPPPSSSSSFSSSSTASTKGGGTSKSFVTSSGLVNDMDAFNFDAESALAEANEEMQAMINAAIANGGKHRNTSLSSGSSTSSATSGTTNVPINNNSKFVLPSIHNTPSKSSSSEPIEILTSPRGAALSHAAVFDRVLKALGGPVDESIGSKIPIPQAIPSSVLMNSTNWEQKWTIQNISSINNDKESSNAANSDNSITASNTGNGIEDDQSILSEATAMFYAVTNVDDENLTDHQYDTTDHENIIVVEGLKSTFTGKDDPTLIATWDALLSDVQLSSPTMVSSSTTTSSSHAVVVNDDTSNEPSELSEVLAYLSRARTIPQSTPVNTKASKKSNPLSSSSSSTSSSSGASASSLTTAILTAAGIPLPGLTTSNVSATSPLLRNSSISEDIVYTEERIDDGTATTTVTSSTISPNTMTIDPNSKKSTTRQGAPIQPGHKGRATDRYTVLETNESVKGTSNVNASSSTSKSNSRSVTNSTNNNDGRSEEEEDDDDDELDWRAQRQKLKARGIQAATTAISANGADKTTESSNSNTATNTQRAIDEANELMRLLQAGREAAERQQRQRNRNNMDTADNDDDPNDTGIKGLDEAALAIEQQQQAAIALAEIMAAQQAMNNLDYKAMGSGSSVSHHWVSSSSSVNPNNKTNTPIVATNRSLTSSSLTNTLPIPPPSIPTVLSRENTQSSNTKGSSSLPTNTANPVDSNNNTVEEEEEEDTGFSTRVIRKIATESVEIGNKTTVTSPVRTPTVPVLTASQAAALEAASAMPTSLPWKVGSDVPLPGTKAAAKLQQRKHNQQQQSTAVPLDSTQTSITEIYTSPSKDLRKVPSDTNHGSNIGATSTNSSASSPLHNNANATNINPTIPFSPSSSSTAATSLQEVLGHDALSEVQKVRVLKGTSKK